jgi:DNA repair protein RadC
MGRRLDRTMGALRIREVAASYVRLPSPTSTITDPESAATIFAEHFETPSQPQEQMMAMYLDGRNRLVAVEMVYRGTVNVATVGSRDILRSALLLNSTAIIVAHLHPSGDPSPSSEDLLFTRKLLEATSVMGIDLHDHLILGFNMDGKVRFVSLRQRGLI